MDVVDIIMLIVCVPLMVMMGVLVYILIAMMLKEESDVYIWPFKKKEEE